MCPCAMFYLHWQRNWRTQRPGHEDGVATGWSRWPEPLPAIQTALWFRGHCHHLSRLLTSGAEVLGGTSCDYASGYPCWARQEASLGFLLSAAEYLISAKIQHRISSVSRSHTKGTHCTARIDQPRYSLSWRSVSCWTMQIVAYLTTLSRSSPTIRSNDTLTPMHGLWRNVTDRGEF
jgi:hypothetical protein